MLKLRLTIHKKIAPSFLKAISVKSLFIIFHKVLIERNGVADGLNRDILVRAVNRSILLIIDVDRREADYAAANIAEMAGVCAGGKNERNCSDLRENFTDALLDIIELRSCEVCGLMIFVAALGFLNLNAVLGGYFFHSFNILLLILNIDASHKAGGEALLIVVLVKFTALN